MYGERREYFDGGAAFLAGPESEPDGGRYSSTRLRPGGGAESIYPEYRKKQKDPTVNVAKTEPISRMPPPPPKPAPDGEIHVLPVQGNVYMLVGAGGNITASFGKDGILLVDAGREDMSTKVMSTILKLATEITASAQPNRCVGLHCPQTPGGWTSPSLNAMISSPAPPKPIRFIFNTSIDADHTGGNAKLKASCHPIPRLSA